MIKCKVCNGTGDCPFCMGSGVVEKGFVSKMEVRCEACDGLGICERCRGSGMVQSYSGNRVRIRCPECGFLKDIFTRRRPVQIDCVCGTTVVLND
jgi:hypothetical protein